MSKYKRAADEDNLMSYSEELTQVSAEPQLDAEEESYKKRYQDIQRHIQTVRNQADEKVQTMQQQLEQATRKQIKFPKTDEEVEAWASKYPDVAKIVDTIAHKRANEVLAQGEKRLEKVEQFERQVHKQGAEQQLMQMHPDFSSIRQDKKFHDWVALQPQALQDSVYKNNTDATWASRTIDLYKADTGNKSSSRTAAQSVGRTSKSSPASTDRATFSESAVDRMSSQEYADNEVAIMEAIKSGKFSYDMSGSAR